MLLLILLPAFLFYVETATVKMVVVYGSMGPSLSYGQANTTLTTQMQCIAACYYSESCVVAHSQASVCYLFMFDSVPDVYKTNASSGTSVVFKVIAPSDTCPIGTNPPTFNGANASGYLTHTYFGQRTKTYYNFTYTSSLTWKMNYRSYPQCNRVAGALLQRSDGNDMCVGTYSTARGLHLDLATSTMICSNNGGTLPAINYPNDIAYYKSLIKQYIMGNEYYTSDFYIRIDGVRTKACQANPTTATCMSPAGFTFTDNGFKNFNNYVWVTDSSARASSDDDCLVFVVRANNTATMKVDVRSCTNQSPFPSIAHLCVRAAFT